MSDTPPDAIHIDPETWATSTPVPAIERRSFTPDPDAARYLPPALRPSGAVPTVPQPPNDTPTPLEASTLPAPPTPPDDVPQQGNAAALLGAALTPGPNGAPSLASQLLPSLGGGAGVVVVLVALGLWYFAEQIKADLAASEKRQTAQVELLLERRDLQAAHTRLEGDKAHEAQHDQERRELDARLDKLLQVVERQDAKLDDLATKVGELQPKRR